MNKIIRNILPFRGFQKFSNVLIKPENLTEILNQSDGRIVNRLQNPINIELMDKMELGNDSFIYRFALPNRNSCLGH